MLPPFPGRHSQYPLRATRAGHEIQGGEPAQSRQTPIQHPERASPFWDRWLWSRLRPSGWRPQMKRWRVAGSLTTPGWSKGDVNPAESSVATLNACGKVAFTFRPQGGPTALSGLESRALCYRGGRLGRFETG